MILGMSEAHPAGGASVETPTVGVAVRRIRRPSWLDLRLIAGVLLVVGSVVAGAFVVSSADHRTPVWKLSRDLAAGTVLQASDVRAERVQLGAARRGYVAADVVIAGKVLRAAAHRDELLPAHALATADGGVAVVIPFQPENAPRLNRGDRIAVWVSAKACGSTRVLISGQTVLDARQPASGGLNGSAGGSVLVRLAAPEASDVISALGAEGVVVRIGVLGEGQAALPVTRGGQADRCQGPE
jgi:hypothetical protein